MVGKVRDSHINVNLPVTNVPTCTGSNAKTLSLHHLIWERALDLRHTGVHNRSTAAYGQSVTVLALQRTFWGDGADRRV